MASERGRVLKGGWREVSETVGKYRCFRGGKNRDRIERKEREREREREEKEGRFRRDRRRGA